MVAELIGTFILVFCGTGAIIASAEGDGTIGPLAYIYGFGFALIFIVYAIRHISGAHVNPAVTLGLALSGTFPMGMVPFYWGAQILGAVIASSILRLTFGNVANLGATGVSAEFSVFNGLVLEIVLAAILVFVAHAALTDERFPRAASGLAIGGALFVIQVVAGPITGGSVNPARSLAPAILSNTYSDLWIYLIAPFIGSVIGALAYQYIRPADADDVYGSGVQGVVRDSRGGPPRRTRDERAERQRRERAEHRKSRPAHTDHGDPVDRPGRRARPQVTWEEVDDDAVESPGRPQRSERPERTERPDRSARPDRPNRRERTERPERAARADFSERPERAERPPRRERSERTDVPPRNERMDWIERPDRPTGVDRPVEPLDSDDVYDELDVDVDEYGEPMPPTTPPRNTR